MSSSSALNQPPGADTPCQTEREEAVLRCDALPAAALSTLFQRFGIEVVWIADGTPIPGSWFGTPEAGIIRQQLLIRGDTPLHSALHEGCHLICMDQQRRAALHTNAGGDYDEENGVNYLQILLADHLPGVGRLRMQQDMDRWGYSFRLGSAQAWFEQDAKEARDWLRQHQLIDNHDQPCWQLRL